ncbi:ADP-ribosylglycohydrolase family protein [Accumulibacter sp.]|uniref:ADP-ribosylglycohydrolase family protein n=1 Tax=Accumulibacter sp. TaxID=2053492 RepID=UPI001A642F83|nr:ADP-ribosylglycohydrolase family protein [Accumulibacter sp.]MBL8401783.1 ADP-ribosylglycohydrolase family protein [Accumulibacter sp.]
MTKTESIKKFQRRIPSAAVRERYQGCLLGGAVGDALGAPVEFMSCAEIQREFGPQGITDLAPAYGKLGAITDDTQMTLFTAEGALRAYVRGTLRGICSPPSVIHYAYLRWLYTQGEHQPRDKEFLLSGWLIGQKALFSRRAPGRTCVDALRRSIQIGQPAQNDSKGCGGVMRVAPIGMLFHALTQSSPSVRSEDLARTFDLGCDAAALTHGHPTGFLTAGVMAALVFELLDGSDLAAAIDRVTPLLTCKDRYEETRVALQQALSLHASDTAPDAAIRQLGQGWIAEEALAIGVYCALKARDFETGVMMAVNHDGDSDSTGLIAGHLLGAMLGRAAIPARWLAPLELREVMEEMADDLATAGDWRLGDWDDPDASAEEDYYTERYPGA